MFDINVSGGHKAFHTARRAGVKRLFRLPCYVSLPEPHPLLQFSFRDAVRRRPGRVERGAPRSSWAGAAPTPLRLRSHRPDKLSAVSYQLSASHLP